MEVTNRQCERVGLRCLDTRVLKFALKGGNRVRKTNTSNVGENSHQAGLAARNSRRRSSRKTRGCEEGIHGDLKSMN
jgi:hypothetical protein